MDFICSILSLFGCLFLKTHWYSSSLSCPVQSAVCACLEKPGFLVFYMLKVWNVLVPTASCRGKICGQIQFSYSINVTINASTYLCATSFIYIFHNSILRSLQVQFVSSFAIDNRMYNSSTELEYQACQFFFSSPLFNLCGIRINFFSIFLFWRKAAPLNFQDQNYD